MGIIITTGDDHKTIIWDAETGKMLYTRLQLTDGDWLAYDEHYRYDFSEGAREHLYFTCGLEIIDLAQLKDALYVPGLVEKIMNGEDINYPKLSDLQICDALPIVERIESEKVHYHYKITTRRLGLEYVEVYINGKKVYTFQKNDLTESKGVFYLRIKQHEITKHFISGEENKVNVVAKAR
ncbi:MAG: hypothetical protein KGZ97_00010 [Bacteroidetes bacterium]|nr:hypothetical protein [Bacteroidota bacterium]